MINNKGCELIPFEYDEIEGDKYYSEGGYRSSGYIVKKKTEEGYRYGYINSKWKKVVDLEYSSISRILDTGVEDIYLIAEKKGQFGILKGKDEQTDFMYQAIVYNKEARLLAVQRNEKYGVINLKGDTVVNVEYSNIKFNGMYVVARAEGNDVYFNEKGEKIENGLTGMRRISEIDMYITTDQNNLYGLVDSEGRHVVENQYLYLDYAFGNYFIAYKEGQGSGVIDNENNVILPFEYDILSKVGEKDLIKGVKMQKGNDETIIFSKGLEKITSLIDAQIALNDDYIKVYNEDTEIYIDNSGNIKSKEELGKGIEFLGKFYKSYKGNGEIYYTDKAITDEHGNEI